jgi:FMN-dependent NADH-azoreductase
MAKLIYIESSPRKSRSHSIKVSEAFLDSYAKEHPNDTIEKIDLWAEALPPFSDEVLDAKYSIMHGSEPSENEKKAGRKLKAYSTGLTPGISMYFPYQCGILVYLTS